MVVLGPPPEVPAVPSLPSAILSYCPPREVAVVATVLGKYVAVRLSGELAEPSLRELVLAKIETARRDFDTRPRFVLRAPGKVRKAKKGIEKWCSQHGLQWAKAGPLGGGYYTPDGLVRTVALCTAAHWRRCWKVGANEGSLDFFAFKSPETDPARGNRPDGWSAMVNLGSCGRVYTRS